VPEAAPCPPPPCPAGCSLTAAECITYSAALRLDHRLPASAVQRRVCEVLQELGLLHVAGARACSCAEAAGKAAACAVRTWP
jgi:hypothetical protein